MEKDGCVGIVEKYLNELLPDNWSELSVIDRLYYFNKEFDCNYVLDKAFDPAIYQCEEVRPMKIWVECFNKK